MKIIAAIFAFVISLQAPEKKETRKRSEKRMISVVCYHDKNDNNTIDFELNGMPMEDYGASNNVMSFGPPQYESTKFEVADKNVTLEIKF